MLFLEIAQCYCVCAVANGIVTTITIIEMIVNFAVAITITITTSVLPLLLRSFLSYCYCYSYHLPGSPRQSSCKQFSCCWRSGGSATGPRRERRKRRDRGFRGSGFGALGFRGFGTSGVKRFRLGFVNWMPKGVYARVWSIQARRAPRRWLCRCIGRGTRGDPKEEDPHSEDPSKRNTFLTKWGIIGLHEKRGGG